MMSREIVVAVSTTTASTASAVRGIGWLRNQIFICPVSGMSFPALGARISSPQVGQNGVEGLSVLRQKGHWPSRLFITVILSF